MNLCKNYSVTFSVDGGESHPSGAGEMDIHSQHKFILDAFQVLNKVDGEITSMNLHIDTDKEDVTAVSITYTVKNIISPKSCYHPDNLLDEIQRDLSNLLLKELASK
jgi:hypothetical protein